VQAEFTNTCRFQFRWVVAFVIAVPLTTSAWSIFDFLNTQLFVKTILNVLYIVIVPVAAIFVSMRRGYFIRLGLPLFYSYLLLFYIFVVWCFSSISIKPPLGDFLATFSITLVIPMLCQVDIRLIRTSVLYFMLLVIGLFLIHNLATLLDILAGTFYARLGSDDGNPLPAARLFLFCAFSALLTLWKDGRLLIRIAALPCAILALAFGMACGQRGPILGFFMAMITVVFFVRSGSGYSIGGRVVLIAVIASSGWWFIANYLPVTHQRFFGSDNSNYERLRLYKQSFADISLLGEGVFSLGSYSHNLFLEMLQDYGVVGLGLLLSLTANAFYSAVMLHMKHGSTDTLWLLGTLVYYLTVHQFSFSLFNPALWIALLLPTALYRLEKQQARLDFKHIPEIRMELS
jgi:hypothetical protein